MGYNQENMGYNDPSMGYNQENMGYNDPSMGYNQESMGYDEDELGDNEERLIEVAEPARRKERLDSKEMKKIICELCSIQPLTTLQLSQLLNRSFDVIRKNYVYKMVENDELQLVYPEKAKHPKQAYKTKEFDSGKNNKNT